MSMREVAKHLSAMGRHGDTTLVHMSPAEVKALHGIGSLTGSEITINPKTGLPEAFSFGDFFKSILPTIVGAVAAPLTGGGSLIPVLAGAATGAALNSGNPLMGALTGGLGGFGGAGIGNAISAAGGAGSAVGSAGSGITQASAGLSGTAPAASGFTGAGNIGFKAAELAPSTASLPTVGGAGVGGGALPTLGDVGIGGGAAATQPATSGMSKFVESLGGTGPNADLIAAGKVGLPVGIAALSSMEPPALPKEKEEKYDPYATLNLSGDSGLRFFAEGGPVYETADPGSNPAQDAIEAREYGIGGLSSYASGGNVGLFADTPGLNIGNGLAGSSGPYSPAQFERLYNAYRSERATGPGYQNFGGQIGAAQQLQNIAKQRGVSYSDFLKNRNAGLSPEQIQFNKFMERSNPTYGYGPNDPFNKTGQLYQRNLSPEQKEFNAMLDAYNNQGASYIKSQLTPQEQSRVAHTGMFGAAGLANRPNTSVSAYSKPLNIWQGQTEPTGNGLFGDNSAVRFARGGYLDGPGDGMSDSIPATIEGKQPARLADGEFVVPADVVSHLGNGSTKAGAQRLYSMMDKVRKARTGSTKQGRQINPNKYMPA